MQSVNPVTYLADILDDMAKPYPNNRIVNIVCHGHSVPAGYFATPYVNMFSAYPHLLHQMIKERFPFAVVNVIVSAKGGEPSTDGAERFESDVLNHNPDVITIDYDRGGGTEKHTAAWEKMIELSLAKHKKVILLTPTWENSYFTQNDQWKRLVHQAEQIRALAAKYQVGLADSFACWEKYVREDADLVQLLSHVNHPTKRGHELVALELSKFFLAR